MTQCLFGVLRYAHGTDMKEAAGRLALLASNAGLGIRVGLKDIPLQGPDDQEELRVLRHLAERSDRVLPFELTSSPEDDNIEEVFENEFNPPWEATADRSRVVSFLRNVFQEPNIENGSIAIYEKPGPPLEELPRNLVGLAGLETALTGYYAKGASGRGPTDAIYDVTKT